MNLQIVNPSVYRVYFTCVKCGKQMVLSKAEDPIYADLDGEPFKAYYCTKCAQGLSHGLQG